MTAYDKLEQCYNCIKKKIDFKPEIALVLGSGLGDYAESAVEIHSTINYEDIKGFPRSTVEGHKGRFVFGYVNGVPVVVMQGRVHYYEGYPMTDVVLPARLMAMMGAKVLFLTNASGGVNADFTAGDFMLITDHISSFVPNPLIGSNLDKLGTRFPDMSEIYNKKLCDIIRNSAKELDIKLQEGVYLQLTGPSFESPAEIRMCRTLGADAVGMSTAVEAITANHAGMKVCGISCISNLACGMTDNPLTHAEVQEMADKAAPKFKALITESIENISDYLNTSGIK
ncbi:MAG: purine-nucleoside phosphorylase [Oscillospiraceae bacterium]